NSGNSSNSDSKNKDKKDVNVKADSAKNNSGGGGSAISAGKKYIGNSTYVFGAQDPSSGQFDCSGFVSWAYKQEGKSLPSHTDGLAGVGSKVSYGDAKHGDLVFFYTFKKNGHVGFYTGGGNCIGFLSSNGVVVADLVS